MNCMSGIRRDFVATYLRSQLKRLCGVLDNIEEEKADCEFTYESLREIEANLRHIRKLCTTN